MATSHGVLRRTEVPYKFPANGYVPLKQLEGGFSLSYASTSTLAQHVSYALSDKIFTYSPESFNLDTSVKRWQEEGTSNAFGFVPGVQQLETRLGAGSLALGYVFSPDFDLAKRHIPQSILASSGSLLHLRESLNQLSLLHALANPVVAHISSVDYNGDVNGGLVSDYSTALELTDELGFALVNSFTAQEAQHISLLATLLSKAALPSVHIFNGLSAQDTHLVPSILSHNELKQIFDATSKQLATSEAKHLDNEGKALKIFKLLNDKLKATYKPFEYHGHEEAETVFVTFGSTESVLAGQVASSLSENGHTVGSVNVRLYRPFIEEEFLNTLPKSVRSVVVLGQVDDEERVKDSDVHSQLYQDVLAALTLSNLGGNDIMVTDEKYSRQHIWETKLIDALFRKSAAIGPEEVVVADAGEEEVEEPISASAVDPQFRILADDDSPFSKAVFDLAYLAGSFPNASATVHKGYDNLVQGGISSTDISFSGSLHSFSPNITFIGSEKILTEIDVLESVRDDSAIILSLSGVTDEDLEKKLPAEFRAGLVARNIKLYVLDASASPSAEADSELLGPLLQFSIRKVLDDLNIFYSISGAVAYVNGFRGSFPEVAAEIDAAFRQVEIPESWADATSDKPAVKAQFKNNSFASFDQIEDEAPSYLEDWIVAAKGAVFKEAYGTKLALRPDVGVKTAVVHVKEHRRLTPMSYDRNVFHIEFDLGDSGLTYAIGEALGIHAENNPEDIASFIKWYNLNVDEVVQVPNRDDATLLENRTVYQALIQNVDIFGRPPKRFYEALAEFATDENEKKDLLLLSQPEGATEFKRRAEVDTITYADLLLQYPSAHPSFHDLIRIVTPLKRREYSIASSQHVTPTSVALLIVTVEWVDPQGRDRFGLATRFLNSLKVGTAVTVSVKPSVMKLPTKSTAPIIMAGLGTGLAPFRAFVQERAYQRDVLNQEIGSVLLYLGSRHQREEYLYGEEWEAYEAAGVVTLIGKAFSRDQPQKIYIQDRMRQTIEDIQKAYFKEDGSFYLCGPTWPVPDVTEVLQEAVEKELKASGAKKVDGRREIETLKEAGRFVLEVY